MDAAAHGAAALAASDFPSAITHYSNAIASNPQAVDYYIKRSMAHVRTSPADYTSSIQDAETAVLLATRRGKRELIAESQLRRGIALYGLQRWGDAQQCFSWAGKFNYDEKVLKIWETKVRAKLKDQGEGGDEIDNGRGVIKEVPEIELPSAKDAKSASNTSTTSVASTKGVEKKPEEASFVASKTRYDWYQSAENVVVTLFAKGISKDQVKIDLHPGSLQLSFPTPFDIAFEYKLDPLYADIEPSTSTSKIMSTKIEITLRKAHPGHKWPSLERSSPATSATDSQPNTISTTDPSSPSTAQPPKNPPKPTAPAYPTSSKTGPKDWDKLAASFAKKKTKNAKPDAGGADIDPTSDPEVKGSKSQKGQKNNAKNNNIDDGDEAEDDDEGIDYEMDGDGGDEVGAFFKQIYKGASPDARRAMMKSYQESNGTALSTNWEEVAKGKVETVPPAGMEERKWGK